MGPAFGYSRPMDSHHDAAHYLEQIARAESYHDLAIFRSRFFGLIERTLSKEECQKVKDFWQTKARDESLPVAPANKA